MATSPAATPSTPRLVRGLGLLDATTLIVGSVIGSGIFVAPSIMAGYVQSPPLLLALWLIGGALTLFGALAYGELAAALPRAGGQYVFLNEAFSPLWGFLYGWTFLVAINTGFVAAVAVAFAKYLGVFLPGISEDAVLFALGRFRFTTAQAAGLVVIAAVTAINVRGLRAGALVQNVFTIAKVSGVAALMILALASGHGALGNLRPPGGLTLGPEGLKLGLFAAMAVAMSKALFAYDAWNSITFAAEEVKEPEKNLPRSLLLGTVGVTLVYCTAVAIYLYMVPISEMFQVKDNRIAAEAASRALGPPGAAFIAGAILVSTFGCVNGLTLAGARVVYAMARDGLFFSFAAAVHPRFLTPARAVVLHGVVAALLTLSGTYSDLITLSAFSSLLFNVLTVIGLFVLRRTRADLHRPYRAWGYPVLPALYVLVATFFLVYILIGDPRNSGRGLVLTAVGLPFYLYWKGKQDRPASLT
jgi:basic amino acid/polyamine antiporter, APA family